jgi:pimeloyl-ACP methyl ester carboxylesterase
MIKAGFHLARKGGRRAFLHAVLGECEADVALLADEEFNEAITTGSQVALSDTHTAHDAMSRNVLEQARVDWAEAVRAAHAHDVPVHMVSGAQDVQVPPATLEEFRQDYPWMTFHVYEDAGQLVLFSKWRNVLDILRPYL